MESSHKEPLYTRTTYNIIKKLFAIKLAFSLTLYAGFFGVFNFFTVPEAQIEEKKAYNAQTVPLLEASLNPNTQAAIGGADIVIVDDSALYPETGNGTSVSLTPSDFVSQNAGKISTYVVQDGDTISQIAEMFGVSTNTIRWGNDIDTDSTIRPGDRLVILPVSGVRHTVVSGDTIASIAQEYEGNEDEILRFNELSAGAELAEGDVVVIPNGEMHQEAPAPSSSGSYAKASASASGYFINPVPGAVVTQYLHGYNAIDLGAPVGTPIYAAASGEVIVSKQGGWNGGYGNYIVIKHTNGAQTLYSHNSSNTVYVGQYVEQGDLIGYVGQSGRVTGPHLHFEVRGATNPLAK